MRRGVPTAWSGDWIFTTCGNESTVFTASLMTATKAGSSAFSRLDWMNTISPCSSLTLGKPDSSSWSAFLA